MTDFTPTDWRALCARMADELDHYRQLLMDDRRETHPLAAEARFFLALSEPQGSTEGELLKLEVDELLYDLIDQAYDLADQELEGQ